MEAGGGKQANAPQKSSVLGPRGPRGDQNRFVSESVAPRLEPHRIARQRCQQSQGWALEGRQEGRLDWGVELSLEWGGKNGDREEWTFGELSVESTRWRMESRESSSCVLPTVSRVTR